ncbi:hypothetical protein Tco_1527594 [Tanacetum coccineum]
METIHVEFEELRAMSSEQFGSGPKLHLMTPGIISSRLPSSVVSCALPAAVAPIPVDTICTSSSTLVDQYAPSPSTSPTIEDTHSLILHQDVER